MLSKVAPLGLHMKLVFMGIIDFKLVSRLHIFTLMYSGHGLRVDQVSKLWRLQSLLSVAHKPIYTGVQEFRLIVFLIQDWTGTFLGAVNPGAPSGVAPVWLSLRLEPWFLLATAIFKQTWLTPGIAFGPIRGQ